MRVAPTITLSDDYRQELERWSRGRSTQARQMLRAKIVLAAAEGKYNQTIVMELIRFVCWWENGGSASPSKVGRHCQRCARVGT